MNHQLPRRAAVTGTLLLAVLLTGCGQGAETATGAASSSPGAVSSAEVSDAAVAGPASTSFPVEANAFPVTIEHEFGSTTVPAEPMRVVTIGATDQDTVIALGVTPVAIDALWPYDTGLGPWASAGLQGAAPVVLKTSEAGEINYEFLAAQQPDLILAVQSGVDDAAYATLSQIAPTIARPAGTATYGASLEQETLTVGAALGRPAAAEQLLADYNTALAETVAANPQWQGKTVVAGTLLEDGGFGALTVTSPEMQFLGSLGLAPVAAVAAADPTEWAVDISKENLSELDADVLLFMDYAGDTESIIAADPLWQGVPAVAAGRVLYLQAGDEVNQIGRQTVSANTFGLENFTPMLNGVLG